MRATSGVNGTTVTPDPDPSNPGCAGPGGRSSRALVACAPTSTTWRCNSMYGILDLTWVPTEDEPTLPLGKADAIVRGDDYELPIDFSLPNGDPFNLEGVWAAQIRAERLTLASVPEEPLATFEIDVVGNVLNLLLPRAVTKTLVRSAFWDLERTLDDRVKTIFSGRTLVVDHVTEV